MPRIHNRLFCDCNLRPFASAILILLASQIAMADEVQVVINTNKVIREMQGGMGASWHAIEKPIIDQYDPRFGLTLHGGSGWGGNPPVSNTQAWEQIERHAQWLGLDFIRVEFEQRMYQPEKDRFDFDNEEMQALYRILDWCEANQADVFLQQMWGNVRWNTWEPWQDSESGVVHSGPRSMEDFSEGLATCVDHLINEKGYTCIRWLSITNEPGGFWGWWQKPDATPLPPGQEVDERQSIPMDLPSAWEAVRQSLDSRGIDLPICGPQHVPPPKLQPENIDYDHLLGAYDLHSYYAYFDWMPEHNYFYPLSQLDERLGNWTKWAHKHGKPFFLTELGCKVFGETNQKGDDRDTAAPISFPAAIHNAEIVLRGLNLGVDGFNRWSLTNRGDLDGQWQMVKTFDPETKKYLSQIDPHPNSYFVYGLLSRFTAKHSSTLDCAVQGGSVEEVQRVFASALRSPKGQLTIAIVNDAPTAWEATFDVRGLASSDDTVSSAPKGETRLYRYTVSEADRDRSDLTVEPQGTFSLSADTSQFSDSVAPMSLTIYSTYKLNHSDPGVIKE